MKQVDKPLSILCFSAGVLLASCAQPSNQELALAEKEPVTLQQTEKQVKLGAPFTTVKPGASVTFLHEKIKTAELGENGSVLITVNEGYPSGTLVLEATGDSGLDVFGASRVAEFDMASGTTHSWRVEFQPRSDGVFYINVLATAQPEGGSVETRAYAVRVNAGDWSAAKLQEQTTMPMQVLEDDRPAIMLQAEEVIP